MVVAIEVMRSGRTVSQIGTFDNLPIAKLKSLQRYYRLRIHGAQHTALLPSDSLHSNQTLLCGFLLLDSCPMLYLQRLPFPLSIKILPISNSFSFVKLFSNCTILPLPNQVRAFSYNPCNHILLHMMFIFCLALITFTVFL